ncbi:hypothetical protein BHM03_00017581 [Ensete ventricosum]|nr:hypothetical protein BHM03_00017581 [Ensete ventricosum]
MAEKMGKRGVKAGEKSQFSITCSLLNQYLKKKGSLGTIGLDMSPWPLGHQPTGDISSPLLLHRAPTTLSLLPGVSVSAEDHTDHGADQHAPKPAVPPAMEESASDKYDNFGPFTSVISFTSRAVDYVIVLVFDHFPVDKAKDVVQMAGKETCKTPAPNLVLFSSTSGSQLPPLRGLPKPTQGNASRDHVFPSSFPAVSTLQAAPCGCVLHLCFVGSRYAHSQKELSSSVPGEEEGSVSSRPSSIFYFVSCVLTAWHALEKKKLTCSSFSGSTPRHHIKSTESSQHRRMWRSKKEAVPGAASSEARTQFREQQIARESNRRARKMLF